ncbi:hypothetical protein ABZ455_14570, partial [Streptomyces avermitilis]
MAVNPAPLVARPASAESRWSDADLGQDFEDSAPDSEADALITPLTAEDMRATSAVLAARRGRPPTFEKADCKERWSAESIASSATARSVRSTRGALLVFPPVGFPEPPPEPGVPVSGHRALHKSRFGV